MEFASIRVITADIRRLVGFYEQVTGITATWYAEDFAEIVTRRGVVAVAHERTMKLFADGAARPAENRSVILELLDDDVDATFQRVTPHLGEVLQPPTTMPWGNRSLLVRDPDGNLLNCFTPVTDAAKQRAARS
jgi:predicted enzyme related to lactoylglutathione lyase